MRAFVDAARSRSALARALWIPRLSAARNFAAQYVLLQRKQTREAAPAGGQDRAVNVADECASRADRGVTKPGAGGGGGIGEPGLS